VLEPEAAQVGERAQGLLRIDHQEAVVFGGARHHVRVVVDGGGGVAGLVAHLLVGHVRRLYERGGGGRQSGRGRT